MKKFSLSCGFGMRNFMNIWQKNRKTLNFSPLNLSVEMRILGGTFSGLAGLTESSAQ